MMTNADPQWSDLRDRRMAVPDHVVSRELGSETIILDVRTGRYHSLNGVGGRFFAVLRESRYVEDARDSLIAEYEQPADRITTDLVRFCDVLRRLELAEFRAG